MRVCALYSGGKDSNYALWCALQTGWEVAALLTVRPASSDSWMFHHPATEWTWLQAEAIGLPLASVETAGRKDEELEDLKHALRELKGKYGLDGLISGAIDSEYQKSRIDYICEELGLHSFAPLWRKDPRRLIEEEVASGFKIMVTACTAMGLAQDWLGRILDADAIVELESLSGRYGIHMAFEGGEAESFVLDGPTFRKRIVVEGLRRHWRGDRGFLAIEGARLEEKSAPSRLPRPDPRLSIGPSRISRSHRL